MYFFSFFHSECDRLYWSGGNCCEWLLKSGSSNVTEAQEAASEAHKLVVSSLWAMRLTLTFWEEPGPRWPEHRWPFEFASRLSRRRHCLDFGPQICCWWEWTCPPCTVPMHPSASGTRCRDAHCSSSPPAGHWCWDTEFHLRQFKIIHKIRLNIWPCQNLIITHEKRKRGRRRRILIHSTDRDLILSHNYYILMYLIYCGGDLRGPGGPTHPLRWWRCFHHRHSADLCVSLHCLKSRRTFELTLTLHFRNWPSDWWESCSDRWMMPWMNDPEPSG